MATDNRFEKLAAEGIRGLYPYVPGKPIDELEREYGIRDSVKLASNENPLGPPQSAIRAITAGHHELALYPDGGGFHLKQALAKKLCVEDSCITLGNGSNDVLVLLAETFLTGESEAVVSQYAFVVYQLAVQAVGATLRVAQANPAGHRQAYGHDLESMQSQITAKTRMIFIANPNNPTGTWLASDALEQFIGSVPDDVIIVVDEAYSEYVEESAYPNALEWVARFPNLVVTRTFSKIYGLAGLRVGYSVSHPDIAALLNRVRQPFNVNSLAQLAAIAALSDDGHVGRSRRINSEGLADLEKGLSELGFTVIPSVGNFVLVDMGQAAGRYYEALLQAGVIVRPVGNYGLPNHLRITVGLKEHNERLLAGLETIVSSGNGE